MGLGCTLHVWHGKKRITHNGGHTGFRTLHVQLIEEDLDIIFLSNSGYGNAREDILNMLYNALYDPHALPERPIPMDKGYI